MNSCKGTYLLILSAVLLFPLLIFSQVGINTTTPRATLEVAGDAKISNQLDINVIEALQSTDVPTLLNKDSNNKTRALDVTSPTGVALGYTQKYTIVNPEGDWVLDFDTGINANDYTINLISASFSSELIITFTSTSDNFSLPYSSVFVANGTWHIIADYPSANPRYASTNHNWEIILLIFSNDLSKQLGDQEINMAGNYSASATTPIID